MGGVAGGRGRRRKQGWMNKEFNLNATVQIRSIDQHRDQLVPAERLHDLEKSKFVRADCDRLDSELGPIFLTPGVQLGSRLFERYHADRKSIRGQSHTTKFPGSEVSGKQESSFPAFSSSLEKLEPATFYAELIKGRP